MTTRAAAAGVLARVVNEEVIRLATEHGQHNQFEGHYLFKGMREGGGFEDQLEPLYHAVAARTGFTPAEVQRRYPGRRPSPDSRGVALFGREKDA